MDVIVKWHLAGNQQQETVETKNQQLLQQRWKEEAAVKVPNSQQKSEWCYER